MSGRFGTFCDGSGTWSVALASWLSYARSVADVDARELCRSLLEVEIPRRWAHCQGVARQAASIRPALGELGPLVESAAWLHDIGYAAPLAHAGFHPLDGARYLRDASLGSRPLWTLVAHHTCAVIEAEERGLGGELAAEFPIDDAPRAALSALTYCDMTTGPDGSPLDVEQRITEILARYGPGDVVHRSISRAAPLLRAQVAETEARIGAG